MTLTIRPATTGDSRTLARLSRCLREPHIAREPYLLKEVTDDTVASWFWGLLHGNIGFGGWIAEIDDTPAGYVLVWIREHQETPLNYPNQYVEVYQIAVEPEFRRQGVARALLDEVTKAAASNGVRYLSLHVSAWNRSALDAFVSLGFAPAMVVFAKPITVSTPPSPDQTNPPTSLAT